MQNSSYGHSPPTEILPLFQDPAYCRFPWSFPFSLWLEPASPLVKLLLQFFAFLRRQIMSASCHDCRLSTSVRAVLRSPGKESPGVGESLCSNAHSSGVDTCLWCCPVFGLILPGSPSSFPCFCFLFPWVSHGRCLLCLLT